MSRRLEIPGVKTKDTRRPSPFTEEVATDDIDHGFGWDQYLRLPDQARLGIACSGGGIRSASYCLGALQVLRTSGYLGEAEYLSAVSGGDYISIGHTSLVSETLRAAGEAGKSSSQAEAELFGQLPPWAPSSPEEAHLRDRSSYLAPGASGKVWLALNLLYGVCRHLVSFLAIIYIAAAAFGVGFGWWIGPVLRVPLAGSTGPFFRHVSFALPLVLFGGLGLIAGLSMLARQAEQTKAHPNGPRLQRLDRFIRTMLALQAAVALFGLGLPALLIVLHHRPLGVLGNLAVTAGIFEAGSLGVISASAALVRRGLPSGGKVLKFLMPLLTTLLGPLVVGIPFAGFTYWIVQRADHFWGRPFALLMAAIAMLVVYSFLDESTPNMHLFYRERLASAFIGLRRMHREDTGGATSTYLRFDEPAWKDPIWFSRILAGDSSARLPKLVVCAAVNVSQDVPPGRLAASFTFEHDYSGGPLTGYVETAKLEGLAGNSVLTLPAMMAISGAALSPSMGKMTRPWLRLVLALFNARLGVWLPNPLQHGPLRPRTIRERYDENVEASKEQPARTGTRLTRPGTLYAIREALGLNDLRKRYVYLTDGGHWDNLGLVELLRRGCGQILCFDAAGDDLGHFHTLSEAIALARAELGVWIDIPLGDLMPDDSGFSASDHAVGCITYPNGTTGVLVFAKLALPRDAPQDAKSYHERDPKFPASPLTDQLFNDAKFEAYHSLGAHAGMGVVSGLNAWRAFRPQLPCVEVEPMVPNPFRPPQGPP